MLTLSSAFRPSSQTLSQAGRFGSPLACSRIKTSILIAFSSLQKTRPGLSPLVMKSQVLPVDTRYLRCRGYVHILSSFELGVREEADEENFQRTLFHII